MTSTLLGDDVRRFEGQGDRRGNGARSAVEDVEDGIVVLLVAVALPTGDEFVGHELGKCPPGAALFNKLRVRWAVSGGSLLNAGSLPWPVAEYDASPPGPRGLTDSET